MSERKLITDARDARLYASKRKMVRSPKIFDGTLERLVEEFVLPNLPAPEIVASFHRLLLKYCRTRDPLFLIRYMRDTKRGQLHVTSSGDHVKATDNAPAWWVHYALFHRIELSAANFPDIVATVPTHFFDVVKQIPENISSAGWHVAHIADVKDRNVDWRSWNRDELIARFIRNIHPCNNFPIPKADWQKWGADRRVVGFFASLYSQLYQDVWREFQEIGRVEVSAPSGSATVDYSYSLNPDRKWANVNDQHKPTPTMDSKRQGDTEVVIYSASRLLFKADVIDALREQDRFRIVTPAASFEMSKADFMRAFPQIPQSKSYRESRVYHYPVVPAAAEEFRLPTIDTTEANDV